MTCRVTTTARNGRYKIVTDYTTDPSRPTVLIRSKFVALKGKLSNYRLYVRHDPTLNGNGGGGTGNGGPDDGSLASAGGHTLLIGSDIVTQTNAANRDYAIPVYSALDVDRGFDQATNGFAGAASDGLKQLDASHALTALHDSAIKGNVAQTGRVPLGHHGRFTLALGYGDTQAHAISASQRSLQHGFDDARRDYERGWNAYDDKLVEPRRPHGVSAQHWNDILDEYYLSANYVKAAEDKTFPGAVAASLTSPWGQAVSAGDPANTYFGSYREVFARDLYEAWTAVFLAGDRRTATDMTRFLFERQQQADGSMPRNSLTNGKPAPDSFNTQLDECAYPLVMALAVGLTDNAYYKAHIAPAANFVASHGPSSGPERWEEQSGFSPSTISAEIAGLVAAAIIADRNGDHASARVWRGVADEFQRNLKKWTLTTNGPLSPGRYFIRLSKNGDPNEALSYNVGNGGPTLDQRAIIDAGFLEYARLGLLPASDADIIASLPVVDATIKRDTASGDGFLRYNGDGYGDGSRRDGHPWAPSNMGTGHPWPVLAGERGQYEVDRGSVERRHRAPGLDAQDELGRRPHRRAGVGPARPRGVAVRDRPDGRLDRLPQRQAGWLGLRADVVGGPVRAPHARRGRRQGARSPGLHLRPLRPPRAGHDRADGHRAARPVGGDRLGDRDGHDARRQQRHGGGHQHGGELRDRHAVHDGGLGRRLLADHPAHRRDVGAQHGRHQPLGRDGARRAHRRLRPGAGDADLRRRRSRRRRQRAGQLRLSD